MSQAKTGGTKTEKPRYKLLQKAWFTDVGVVTPRNGVVQMNDVLLDPEEQPPTERLSGPYDGKGGMERVPLVIEFEGVPDEHMEPLNDPAKAKYDRIDELKAEAAKGRKTTRRSRLDPISDLSMVNAQ